DPQTRASRPAPEPLRAPEPLPVRWTAPAAPRLARLLPPALMRAHPSRTALRGHQLRSDRAQERAEAPVAEDPETDRPAESGSLQAPMVRHLAAGRKGIRRHRASERHLASPRASRHPRWHALAPRAENQVVRASWHPDRAALRAPRHPAAEPEASRSPARTASSAAAPQPPTAVPAAVAASATYPAPLPARSCARSGALAHRPSD